MTTRHHRGHRRHSHRASNGRDLSDEEETVIKRQHSHSGDSSHGGGDDPANKQYRILTKEELDSGKTTSWMALQISGPVKYLSDDLWKFQHLTALFLSRNQLTRLLRQELSCVDWLLVMCLRDFRIPSEISHLCHLQVLDLSHNRVRSLPAELGDLLTLLHLDLSHNLLRVIPYELGKLWKLKVLGLGGNPLSKEISHIYHGRNGTSKLLQYFLDNLRSRLKRRRRPSPELEDLSPLSDLGYASDEYCFLSITRDDSISDMNESSSDWNQSMSSSPGKQSASPERPTGSALLEAAKSPPLITITIPSHARIIPRQPSIRLSSDSDESSDAGLSEPDLSPRALTPPRAPSATPWGSLERVIFMHRPNLNPTPLPPREWIVLDHNVPSDRPRVSVMCYNVLCDKYATTAQYSYCPSWALGWEYRKSKILEEIVHCNADILSLQEIETAEFESYFEPSLKKHGYDGIFSPKSRAKTMLEEERKFVDGCAIFWKRDKFSLEAKHPIEFTQLAITYAEGSEQMLNRVMTRDNIALVAVLSLRPGIFGEDKPVEPRLISKPILVCAAHIHWDPEFCDVKLIQAMMLLQEVARIREAAVPSAPAQVPVLLCGDLNSLPESGVFEFLSTGRVSKSHADFRSFVGDPCLDRVIPDQDGTHFTHSLDLNSAYDPDIMPFTNYTFDFRGVIDYVFGSRGLLARTGVLGPLDPDWFRANKVAGCPHPLIPSDHVPLLAEFSLL